MRVLLDENIPVALIQDFPQYGCAHVVTLGWQGIKNGALLAKAEAAGFNVLITFDEDIPKENAIGAGRIAVYVLKPEGQGVANTHALVSEILVALEGWRPGQVRAFTNRKPRQT